MDTPAARWPGAPARRPKRSPLPPPASGRSCRRLEPLLIALLLAVAGAAPGAQKRAAPSKPGRGVALVPAAADGALLLDGAGGIAGIRALLETAGRHAASASPGAIGRSL